MRLYEGERVLRRADAVYARREATLGTLTLTNGRLYFEVHVKTGFRKTSDRPVLEILLDNVQSTQAGEGQDAEGGVGRGLLQVQTPKGIDPFELDRPEDWAEDISNAKLARPPVPGAPRTGPTINVNVTVAAPAGGVPPIRVRCPYCKSVYDESKGRCPSCGARFY